MGQVGGNTRCVHHIVEGKLVDVGGELEQKREGLQPVPVSGSRLHGTLQSHSNKILATTNLADTA